MLSSKDLRPDTNGRPCDSRTCGFPASGFPTGFIATLTAQTPGDLRTDGLPRLITRAAFPTCRVLYPMGRTGACVNSVPRSCGLAALSGGSRHINIDQLADDEIRASPSPPI